MSILNNTYIRQALITAAVIAVLSRVKSMNPMVEKLITGGLFNPAGNANNTSTVA